MTTGEYKIEVEKVTESEWAELLERFEDANLYQTWPYGAVRWGENNLSHLIMKRDGEVVGIAQLRTIRPSELKVGIAYLRWGPLFHLRGRDLDPDVVQAMAAALRQEYVGTKGLYLEIVPNAFLGSLRAQAFESGFAGFERTSGIGNGEYRTMVLDLSPPLDQLRSNLDKKWRNQLNAAERNRLQVVEGDGIEQYRTFGKVYAQMRARKQFSTKVSIEEFERIQQRLPSNHRMRVLLCEQEGQPVAGLVCSELGDSAIYLLGATNEQGMKLKGAYLLQWALIRSLKERGIRYYDLGGINPEANPGVHHFKSGLSGVDLSHISSFSACDSSLSRAAVKTGQMLRNGLLRFQERWVHA